VAAIPTIEQTQHRLRIAPHDRHEHGVSRQSTGTRGIAQPATPHQFIATTGRF
jgi:hypothetical protein